MFPSSVKTTAFSMALLLTAAGGGSGIGAVVTSFKSESPTKALEEVRDELSQLRVEQRTRVEKVSSDVGVLRQRLNDHVSNTTANADATNGEIKQVRDPHARRALQMLNDPDR